MDATCACGLLAEAPTTAAACRECGTVCCTSCALAFDNETYCRWCANWVAASA